MMEYWLLGLSFASLAALILWAVLSTPDGR